VGEFLVIHFEHACSTFGDAGAVIGEVEDDRVLARVRGCSPDQRGIKSWSRL
jgi:hypothetical protein